LREGKRRPEDGEEKEKEKKEAVRRKK